MGYRVDNIPASAARANERIKVIARGMLSEAEFQRKLDEKDEAAWAAFSRASAKYGVAIAMEEEAKGA